MRRIWPEVLKHSFIWGVLVFAFFPLYITLAISVKNNKQFTANPFSMLPLSGIGETFARVPAATDAYDPISITAARDAEEQGFQPFILL